MHELAEILESKAQLLQSPTTDAALHLSDAGWAAWEAKEELWNDDLNRWCELASLYIGGICANVFFVPEEAFKQTGVAKVQQFPSAQAFNTYMAFCRRLKNWRDALGKVESEVHSVAFGGRAIEAPS
jgi:hypothetical protein